MSSKFILLLILGVDAFILLVQASNISLSYTEALVLYGEPSFLQFLLNQTISIFGQNDLVVHSLMISFHLGSLLLLYLISKEYIKQEKNRLWLIIVFALLPGVVSSAVVVNSAGIIIFGLLLFIYLHNRVPQYILNILLFTYAIMDISFSYLFLGLFLYYWKADKKQIAYYMLVLYAISLFVYGLDSIGLPSGHFLDTIGIYSAIFTPIIFIYIVYVLYRRYLLSQKDIIWYISTPILILSLLLSFRQRIPVEHFAPYLIIALPLAAQTFIHSYRVRLKLFRFRYKFIFTLSFIFLLVNTFVVLFNKELYLVLENPKKHFAYNMHVAKELSNVLKEKGIKCVTTDNKMQLRLRFYGIDSCNTNILQEKSLTSKANVNVTIRYKNKTLYKANVTNVNKT